MNFYEAFIEMWTQQFMLRGIIVTGVAAAVCAVLSCWLVLIGWSLLGDALSHAILPGIVVSYLLGTPFAIGALVAALLVVGLIGAVRGARTGQRRHGYWGGLHDNVCLRSGLNQSVPQSH